MKYYGFIRGSRVAVVISAIGNNVSADKIICEITCKEANGEKIIPIPAISKSILVPQHILKIISSKIDSAASNFYFEFEISDFSYDSTTITNVRFFVAQGKVEIAPCDGRFSLMNLAPSTEQQASDALWFKSSKNRHPDAETLSLIAKNVFTNSSLPNSCRVNAFVVYTYKCIELEKTQQESFLAYYDEMHRVCESIGRAHSSKKDGRLLKLSLKTAMWHYFVFQSETLFAIEIIDQIIAEDYSGEETPLFGLNLSCALLFKCLVNLKGGAFMEDADRLINLFYHAVSIKADNSGWFVDYRGIHEKSLIVMQMKESFKNKGIVEDTLIKKAVQICFRINDQSFFTKAFDIIGRA